MKKIFMLFPLVLMVVLLTALGVGGAIAFADSDCTHDYQVEVVNPTCLKEGYTLYKCKLCGDIYKDNYVDTIPHEYIEVKVSPDCIHKGYTTFICVNCGYSYQDNFIDPIGHTYEDEVINPTCLDQGYTKHTCKDCGHQYLDEYVDALGHKFNLEVTEPNCIDGGYTTYTCSECGYSYQSDFVDPLCHDFIINEVKPTCSTYGFKEHVCSRCNDRYVTDYINPLGHHYIEKEVIASNKSLGYTIYSCSDCDYSYVSKISTSKDDGYINGSKDYTDVEENKEVVEDKKEESNKEIEIIPPKEEPIEPIENHEHDYLLDIRIKEDKKVATVKYLCECGDINNDYLSVTITNDLGARYDLDINQNNLVDLYPYDGIFTLSIYKDLDEIFSYEINLPKNEVNKEEEVDPENKEIIEEKDNEVINSGTVEIVDSKDKEGLSETAKILIAVFSVVGILAISGVVAIIVIKKKGLGKNNVK